ncbi:ABC transporter substrate-binding protein [Amycolatopsis acidicola]|uniref:Thiamine pyrimidine synthase n=1 Tax=Amycolatopsis acidicola TaxID=2596893 RepID=A0A5N0VHJ2_9PSEU|nr:ABC transporter substrate-binding protein [Amycolatopsis acidicola]KAA9165847.1 ABC transporter substrate-binding protein [Amycolatopsis acidicola]
MTGPLRQLAVTATSHWPNYLPEYVAAEHGYFADEGLDFRRWAPEPWTVVLDDLDAGRAQIALGGIWVPAMYHGRGREYRAFAALNARNPKAFVTREPVADFGVADLAGKTVLAPGAGSAAYYIHTAGLVRRAGADPADVRFIRDLSGGTLTELFLGGLGDVLITDVVNATVLQHAGHGHIALRVDSLGLMPNSVYYTGPGHLDHEDRLPWAFSRALARASQWLAANPARELKALLRREWPGLDTGLLVDVVDDLRGTGLWADIRIDRGSYDEWQDMLAEEHLIDAPVPFDVLVDPRPAEAAVAALAGSTTWS